MHSLLAYALIVGLASAYKFTVYQAKNCVDNPPGSNSLVFSGSNKNDCALAAEYTFAAVKVNKKNLGPCSIYFTDDQDCSTSVAHTPSANFPADGTCHTFKSPPLTYQVVCP